MDIHSSYIDDFLRSLSESPVAGDGEWDGVSLERAYFEQDALKHFFDQVEQQGDIEKAGKIALSMDWIPIPMSYMGCLWHDNNLIRVMLEVLKRPGRDAFLEQVSLDTHQNPYCYNQKSLISLLIALSLDHKTKNTPSQSERNLMRDLGKLCRSSDFVAYLPMLAENDVLLPILLKRIQSVNDPFMTRSVNAYFFDYLAKRVSSKTVDEPDCQMVLQNLAEQKNFPRHSLFFYIARDAEDNSNNFFDEMRKLSVFFNQMTKTEAMDMITKANVVPIKEWMETFADPLFDIFSQDARTVFLHQANRYGWTTPQIKAAVEKEDMLQAVKQNILATPNYSRKL